MSASAAPGWRAIALIVAGCMFMLNLDSAIIATSLPQVARDFHRPAVALSIGISAYILAGAAVVPLSSWLADRYGARRVLLIALAIFTLASAACGLARSFWPFILARIVQGAGGAVMMPVGSAVVLRHSDRSNMIAAIGLVTWPGLMAPVLGPVLGGFITSAFSWRWNFWLNLPLGLILGLLVRAILPNDGGGARRKLDLPGLALTSTAMILLLAGLDFASGARAHPALAIALVAAGVASGALALRHLSHAATPVLSLSPLAIRTFFTSLIWPGIPFRIAFSATPFLLPLLFQLVYHLTPLQAGALVLIYFVGNLGLKTVTTQIMMHIPFRPLLAINGAIVAATLLACGWLDPAMPKPALFALLLLTGAARSLQLTSLTTLSFADVEPPQKGDASTLSSLVIQSVMAAGVACSALLLNLAQARHGGTAVTAGDFRLAFATLAALCLAAAIGYLWLPMEAGAQLRQGR